MRGQATSIFSESKWPKLRWRSRTPKPAESILWYMFDANLLITALICDELSCGRDKVYGRTYGQTTATTIPLWPERSTVKIIAFMVYFKRNSSAPAIELHLLCNQKLILNLQEYNKYNSINKKNKNSANQQNKKIFHSAVGGLCVRYIILFQKEHSPYW